MLDEADLVGRTRGRAAMNIELVSSASAHSTTLKAIARAGSAVEEDEGDPWAWNVWPAELRTPSRLAHFRVAVGNLASRCGIILSCQVIAATRIAAAATTACWRLVDAAT